VFGALSFLIEVAAVMESAVTPCDDFDEAFGCRPLVDVVEEEGELVVLIEMPGYYSQDVRLKVVEDILIVSDARDSEFHEILLPKGYHLDEATRARFNNGITVIKFPKAPLPCGRRKIA